jgi:excisionase family DNA binding protein
MPTLMYEDPPSIDNGELSIAEVALRLNKSRWYVSRLCQARRIAYRKEGREYRISERALRAYIESTRVPPKDGR